MAYNPLAFNRALQTRLKRFRSINKNTWLVDMITGYDRENYMLHDGIHPNWNGAEFIAGRWVDALQNASILPGYGHVNIMPVGDSITELRMPYRFHLWQMLRAIGYNVSFVGTNHLSICPNHTPLVLQREFEPNNAYTGRSGYTVAQLLTLLPRAVTTTNADVVLYMGGTNSLPLTEDMNEIMVDIQRSLTLFTQENSNITVLIALLMGGNLTEGDIGCVDRSRATPSVLFAVVFVGLLIVAVLLRRSGKRSTVRRRTSDITQLYMPEVSLGPLPYDSSPQQCTHTHERC